MANRLQYARDFDPYAKNVSIDELLRVRRQLSKVMNQRIVRLRDTKSPITGESYTFGAYDLMTDYLKKQGRKRFSEVLIPKMYIDEKTGEVDARQIKKEIRILQGFEELKSSRVAGMREIEEERIKTFTSSDAGATKALHEEIVKTKDFYDFLNSKTYEEIMDNNYDSEKLVEDYDRYAKKGATKEQIIEALEEYMQDLKMGEKISVKGVRSALKSITIEKKGKAGSKRAKSKNKKPRRRSRRV